MSQTVNVHEAKTHLSRLLERAHAGEAFFDALPEDKLQAWEGA
jgi:hypothetical protein